MVFIVDPDYPNLGENEALSRNNDAKEDPDPSQDCFAVLADGGPVDSDIRAEERRAGCGITKGTAQAEAGDLLGRRFSDRFDPQSQIRISPR
jgi:hypothetical protein